MVKGSAEVRGDTRAKSGLPFMLKEVIVAAVVPVLVSTTERLLLAPTVTLPKTRVDRLGEREAAAPVPVRPTVVENPTAPPLLETMVSVSLLSPAVSGANWIRSWALAPGSMLLADGTTVNPTVLPTETLLMRSGAVPVLLMVRVWVPLLPIPMVPKLIFVGLTPIRGIAVPLPVRVTVVVVPPLLVTRRALVAAGPLIEGVYFTVTV
jgi:hypothetical protein